MALVALDASLVIRSATWSTVKGACTKFCTVWDFFVSFKISPSYRSSACVSHIRLNVSRTYRKKNYLKKKLFLIDQENKDTHLWNIKGETLDELVQGGLGAAVRGGHVEVGLAWKVPTSVMTLRLIRISAYHLGARGNHRGSLRHGANKYSIIHLHRQKTSLS